MQIFTVFVGDAFGNRFIDTSWAREDAAVRRVDQLLISHRATKFDGNAWYVSMWVEDLELAGVANTSTDTELRTKPKD